MSVFTEIHERYLRENRVHGVLMELTERCPCDCVHCYVVKEPRDELTTAEVCDYLAQLSAEGAFNLTLTGGDPLMRRDIGEILAEARRHRFFTSVLTSGLPLTEARADEIACYRIGLVEMSLLGADAPTNDALMRRPGAFEKIRQAVKRLRERRVDVVIKVTLMQGNFQQLEQMRSVAESWDAMFNASASVAPRQNGDTKPLELALTTTQMGALDPVKVTGGLIPGEDLSGGGLATCRAGRTVIAVSARGVVTPCILFPRPVGDLRKNTLQEIWHDRPDPFLVEIRGLCDEDVKACAQCTVSAYCRRCPGCAWLETGNLREAGESFCRAAKILADLKGSRQAPNA